METPILAAFWQALTAATSRRGVLAGLSGGLLASGPFAHLVSESLAKKKHKRKKKRKNKKRDKPKTRVDATCPGPGDGELGDSDPNSRLAQTFRAETSGELVRVELDTFKFEGTIGTYVLRIAPVNSAGAPTNDVLAETDVANADVPAGESTVVFTFADPPLLEAGTQYALVLSRPGGDSYRWKTRSLDPCAGQIFFTRGQTFETTVTDRDLIFTTFVRS